jgi:hypothetical protein
MVSIICYTNSTRTLEHSYFTSSQLLRQGNSSITIFQSTDDVLSGSFYLVCTRLSFRNNLSSKSPLDTDESVEFERWTVQVQHIHIEFVGLGVNF